MKKLLVVGVIVIFLGLACAPSINANVIRDNELVAITTEICGLDGGKHTVQLTQKEAEELDRLFENIRQQLNESTSREEAVEIFNDAVVELDRYGLLGGLSIKQVQRLVTGRYVDSIFIDIMEKIYSQTKDISSNSNSFCLIAGETDGTLFCGPLSKMTQRILIAILLLIFVGGYTTLELLLIGLLIATSGPILLSQFNPLSIGYTISFGNDYWNAHGQVWSNGIAGIKEWNGAFIGDLLGFPVFYGVWLWYPGIYGFTGINILLDVKNEGIFPISFTHYYLGSALYVDIKEW